MRLIGYPSLGALRVLAKAHGDDASMVPWNRDAVHAPESVKDYLATEPDRKSRFTFVLTPAVVPPPAARA